MITDYINYEVLKSEGFIREDDYEGLLKALCLNVALLKKRLTIVEVADYLGVTAARLRRYVKAEQAYGRKVMDSDGKMTFSEMLSRNWESLTERKKTFIKN